MSVLRVPSPYEIPNSSLEEAAAAASQLLRETTEAVSLLIPTSVKTVRHVGTGVLTTEIPLLYHPDDSATVTRKPFAPPVAVVLVRARKYKSDPSGNVSGVTASLNFKFDGTQQICNVYEPAGLDVGVEYALTYMIIGA